MIMIDDVVKHLNHIASFALGAYIATNNEAFSSIQVNLESIINEIMRPIDQNRNSEELESILNQRIEDLDMTFRSEKCLNSLGIETIGDLINTTEYDLFTTPNLGKKSLSEIKDALKERGLKLKER